MQVNVKTSTLYFTMKYPYKYDFVKSGTMVAWTNDNGLNEYA